MKNSYTGIIIILSNYTSYISHLPISSLDGRIIGAMQDYKKIVQRYAELCTFVNL